MKNDNLKFKILIPIILFSIFYFLFSYPVAAAELNLLKTAEIAGAGGIINAILILNTEEERINAVEIILQYSSNLELETISDGNSIINFWISKPKINNKEKTLFLSGLIPGGIKTGKGTVLNFNFKSLSSGPANIQIKDAKLLLNNPDATEARTKIANLNFDIQDIADIAPRQDQKLILDFLPPDEFKIYLSKNENMFDGSWFISFNATDKGSGVNYYEIKEAFGGIFGRWIKTDSPYQLYYQNLFSIIKVRAVDNVGRERTAIFIPIRIYLAYGIISTIVAIFLIFKFLKFFK